LSKKSRRRRKLRKHVDGKILLTLSLEDERLTSIFPVARCQLADSNAKIGCSKCDWAFWCCQACKTADVTYEAGHTRECSGRNGEVLRSTAKVKEVETEVSSDPEEVDIAELE